MAKSQHRITNIETHRQRERQRERERKKRRKRNILGNVRLHERIFVPCVLIASHNECAVREPNKMFIIFE